MAVPKRKTSKMKGRKRRTHYTGNVPTLSVCPRCRSTVRPHTVCPGCGYYRNREVVSQQAIEDKKRAKIEAKERTQPQG
jgi:large subunit ribosomal protein L32